MEEPTRLQKSMRRVRSGPPRRRRDHRPHLPLHLPQPPVPGQGPRVHGGHHWRHRPGPGGRPAALAAGGGRRRRRLQQHQQPDADAGALPGVQPHVPHRQHAQRVPRGVRPGPLEGGSLVRGRLPRRRLRAALLRRGEARERPGGQGVGRERRGAAVPQGTARRRARRGRRVGGRQGDHAVVLLECLVRRRCAHLQAQDRRRAVSGLSAR